MTRTDHQKNAREGLRELFTELEEVLRALDAVPLTDTAGRCETLAARQLQIEARILARTSATPREAECRLATAAFHLAREAERLTELAGNIERGMLAALDLLRPEIRDPIARRYRPAPRSGETAT